MRTTKKRSIAKTVSFRIIATITTVLIIFVFTKSFVLSLGIGVMEFVSKLVIYYAHERTWDRIKWGRKRA